MIEGRFRGRVAVVTGGASGLGRDVASRIVAEGGSVVLWDFDETALRETATQIGAALASRVDVSRWEDVSLAAAAALEAVGKVDLLINSAGITGPTAELVDYPLDGWQRVLDINLTGTFHCCRAIAPIMTRHGYGRIVNVASVAAKEGNPQASAYAASKAGVVGLTKSLGKELATSGVLVNAVTPAVFDSPMLLQMPKSQVDYMVSRIPMGRLGKIEETTALICFLLSEECSFSTASTFDTSGGRTTY